MPKTRPPQGPIAPEAATWSPGAVAATLRPHDAEAAAMLAGRFAEKGNAERTFGATAQGAALWLGVTPPALLRSLSGFLGLGV